MGGIVILGILSWIVTGLMKDGTAWLRHHTVFFLVTFPFLFSMAAILVVTLVQFRLDGSPRKQNPTADRGRRTRDRFW